MYTETIGRKSDIRPILRNFRKNTHVINSHGPRLLTFRDKQQKIFVVLIPSFEDLSSIILVRDLERQIECTFGLYKDLRAPSRIDADELIASNS